MIRSSELTIRISIENISRCLRYLHRKHFRVLVALSANKETHLHSSSTLASNILRKFPRLLVQNRQNSAPRRPATPPPVHQIRARRTRVPHNFHILRSTLRQLYTCDNLRSSDIYLSCIAHLLLTPSNLLLCPLQRVSCEKSLPFVVPL